MIILLFPYQILSILGQIPKTDKKFPYQEIKRGCVKMMHPLFRYRTMGFSFFIEYDLFFPVSMLFGGIICRRWLMPP